MLSIVVFFLFGGRELLNRRIDPDAPQDAERQAPDEQSGTGGGAVDSLLETQLDRDKIITLIGIVTLVVLALLRGEEWDVGFVAVSIAVILSLAMPHATKGAADKVAWSTVLLICGIVTYVSLIDDQLGTIDWLGDEGRRGRHAAHRRAADLLHRGRRERVRVDHGHPRGADPARRAVPRAGHGRRGRHDHRALASRPRSSTRARTRRPAR